MLRVLTVGDGDLSFSLALARCYDTQLDITATTLLQSEEELLHTYATASKALDELRNQFQVKVLFNIDATKIKEIFERGDLCPKRVKFDIVMFNHPHLGFSDLSEEEKHAQRHHSLISHYLHSAKSVVQERDGAIHLCLCGEQPQTWRLINAANRCGLTLIYSASTSEPLDRALLTKNKKNEEIETSGRMEETPTSAIQISPSKDTRPSKLISQLVQPGWQAPRRYRNGKLGSRHWLGRYGYIHRRTHGDHHVGPGKDMDVTNSRNFVFERLDKTKEFDHDLLSSISAPSCNDEGKYMCPICEISLPNLEAFKKHLDEPACPDPIFESKCEETGKLFKTKYALETFQTQQKCQNKKVKYEDEKKRFKSRGTNDQESPMETNNFGNGDTNSGSNIIKLSPGNSSQNNPDEQTEVAIVNIEGKRLRWWARQPEAFGEGKQTSSRKLKSTIKSKKQCESFIKEGSFRVNGEQVFDSSRILHIGDKVEWVISLSSNQQIQTLTDSSPISQTTLNIDDIDLEKISSLTHVHVVKRLNTNLFIVWKPAGFRARGQFSDMSVEAILSKRYKTNIVSISRLEIGCSGICLVTRTRSSLGKNQIDLPTEDKKHIDLIENEGLVEHQFIALIHGEPPIEWKEGVALHLPKDGVRRWRRTNHCNYDEFPETSTQNDKTSDSLVMHKEDLAVSDPSHGEPVAVKVQLLETSTLIEDGKNVTLSTIRLSCSKYNGKLCSSLCFMLRKLSFPVVGDRFCKRELANLPRPCRNIMKSKLHIGCFGIKSNNMHPVLRGQDYLHINVDIPAPERFLASHWENFMK